MGLNADSFNKLKQDLMEKFRNELPVLRAKARVSQEIIAEKVGISRQTYSSLETGKREMNWTTFLALVAFFQNNKHTKSMVNQIDGFTDGMVKVMDSPDQKL